MKNIFIYSIIVGLVAMFSGCSTKNDAYEESTLDIDWSSKPDVKQTVNQSIISLANQLIEYSRILPNDKVAITSIVDLHQLNKTTHFGRTLGESLFHELNARGFNVVDARGTKTIRINADGEFFITRDIKLLKGKRIENSYILVGTYTEFGLGVLVNVRIIDNITGDIVSSARTIIDVSYCKINENCHEVQEERILLQTRTIGISDAGCSKVKCPENCYNSECGDKKVISYYTNNKQKKTIKKNNYCKSIDCSKVTK